MTVTIYAAVVPDATLTPAYFGVPSLHDSPHQNVWKRSRKLKGALSSPTGDEEGAKRGRNCPSVPES